MAIFKYLDPKNDVAFKKIFGSEKHKDILIHFINDILGFRQKSAIETVEFLTPIQDPEIASKKQSIVDVLCKDGTGIQYIIEMQVSRTQGFEKRAQYYASKAYCRQVDKGQSDGGKYKNLKEIIFIAISNVVLFPDKQGYKSDHVILDKDTHEHNLKDFYFTFIELPKFNKTQHDQLDNIIEKWCYFFKYADTTKDADLAKIIGSDQVIKKAYDALDQFGWSENELIAYEQETKRIWDNQAVMDAALEDAMNTGMQKGIEKGIQRGRAEGEARGVEKGKQLGIHEGKLEIARKLLGSGMQASQVAEITGLSMEQLQKL
jgi:predicted transposase/invertase (TIGR01784 family)